MCNILFTHSKKNIVTAAHHNTNKPIVIGNTRVEPGSVHFEVGLERTDLQYIRLLQQTVFNCICFYYFELYIHRAFEPYLEN
jgi:hypothetical protein